MKEVKRVKFTDLKFEDHNIIGGIQARLGNISVIQGDFAYTNKEDNYEVGVRNEDGDWEVEGHCDEDRVEDILNGSPLNDTSSVYDAVDSMVQMDATNSGADVLKKLEYQMAKSKLKAKRLYTVSMVFHGAIAAWYFYLGAFTDYVSNPAIVGIWVLIAGINAYFNYKSLDY